MAPRHELNDLLEMICDNVYFQPPSNVQMEYPAIVYQRARSDVKYADNFPYSSTKQYDLTLISRNPDENLFKLIETMPMCRHERFYVSDNLNHDVFTLYF